MLSVRARNKTGDQRDMNLQSGAGLSTSALLTFGAKSFLVGGVCPGPLKCLTAPLTLTYWMACSAVLCHAAQSCPTLWDPVDCSPPGFSVHGVLQARILEWVAMPSLRDSSQPGGLNPHVLHLLYWQVGSLPLMPPGSPCIIDVCQSRAPSPSLLSPLPLGKHRSSP